MAPITSSVTCKDDAGRAIVPNLIDGKPVILPGSASFPIVSSRTQEVVHYGQSATVEVATQAVDKAFETFKTYKKTPVHQRRDMILRLADICEKKADDCTKRQMLETSCEETWAKFNGFQTSTFCREMAGAIAEACTGELPPSHFGFNHLVYKEPVGPVLVISPWNAAVVLAIRAMANALAAGCTVILKASELCPWTHQFVTELFHEAGFPPGAVNMVMADRSGAAEITETLIAHPNLRKIEFIGSAGVGRIIGQVAAKHLKPIVMELGDQSPAIVFDDANLDKAAEMCAKGAMLHHGQVCFSTERIIVQESIREEFGKRLVAELDKQNLNTVAITNQFAEKAKATVDEAVKDGATFLWGRNEMVNAAAVTPSILTNVNPKSSISCREAFAPTAFLVGVKTDEEAIEEANSRAGGLSAAVFTTNHERGLKAARELEFGMVQINNMTLFAEPIGPATCFKGSGWGSNNGKYGIQTFLYSKGISIVPSDMSPGH